MDDRASEEIGDGMTPSEAGKFWEDWIALKTKYDVQDVCVTIDETCEVRFSDGSYIEIDDSARGLNFHEKRK